MPSELTSYRRYTLDQIRAMLAASAPAGPAPRRETPQSREQAGGRNVWLTSLAGTLRNRGLESDEIEAMLVGVNATWSDPLDLSEVRTIAKSIGRKPAGDPAREFPSTDAGNAERFAFHNPDLRYCAEKDRWLAWDGTRWAEDLRGTIAAHRALLTVRKIDADVAACPDQEVRAAMRAWARKSESAERLSAVVKVAKTMPDVKCRVTEFDSDPWILNIENGILDLRRGELRPHDRTAMCSKLAPVRFVAGASHPALEKYLKDVTGGDAAFIGFLQRALGYSLTGNTGAECIFLVLGPGGSGKTTLVEAFKDLLGDYALTAAARTLLEKRSDAGHTSDIARMHGRRLICTSEIAKGKSLDAALVKSLTGGERIVARDIYSADAEFQPMGKFWLAANDAPGVADDDSGMWRRIIRVPFVRVVPEKDRDPKLKETLRNDPGVRSAILAWALQGCLDWQARGGGRQGLDVPGVVHKATLDYKAEQNPLRDFLDEMCHLAEGCRAEVGAMRRAYADFCRSAGTRPLPPHEFNRRLEEMGHSRSTAKILTRSVKAWAGISLVSSESGASEKSM